MANALLRCGGTLCAAVLASWLGARRAEACGGCFVPQVETTQVTGHRMVLSVSQTQTTLWDQVQYAGDPESFAWVLPIIGEVEIGLSSDLLFTVLDEQTRARVLAPALDCGAPLPVGPGPTSAAGPTTGPTGGGGTVEVIAQETVGPYETVQLSTTDAYALHTWLENNGYALPDALEPLVATYVAEGFDFLAMKLVPGAGIDRMRPVRITSPGANLYLPLRMVAAGTGAVTPIALWIVGDGRYQPASFPWFEIHEDELVWNWDTGSSNYRKLRQAGFDATGGHGWLIESSEAISTYTLRTPIRNTVENAPSLSGYGDGTQSLAAAEAEADLSALADALQEPMRVTLLRAELSREALSTDLLVEAADDQSELDPWLRARHCVGEAPCATKCTPPELPGTGGAAAEEGTIPSGGCGACDVHARGFPSWWWLAVVVGATLRRRRWGGVAFGHTRDDGGRLSLEGGTHVRPEDLRGAGVGDGRALCVVVRDRRGHPTGDGDGDTRPRRPLHRGATRAAHGRARPAAVGPADASVSARRAGGGQRRFQQRRAAASRDARPCSVVAEQR